MRAHVGGPAATAASRIGATADATGNDVAFASAPDLHLAAHEAAHVVQQRGGVRLSVGIGVAGDCYEQHADAVADAVVRGQIRAALLRDGAGGVDAHAATVAALTRDAARQAELQALIEEVRDGHPALLDETPRHRHVPDPPRDFGRHRRRSRGSGRGGRTAPPTSLPAPVPASTPRSPAR